MNITEYSPSSGIQILNNNIGQKLTTINNGIFNFMSNVYVNSFSIMDKHSIDACWESGNLYIIDNITKKLFKYRYDGDLLYELQLTSPLSISTIQYSNKMSIIETVNDNGCWVIDGVDIIKMNNKLEIIKHIKNLVEPRYIISAKIDNGCFVCDLSMGILRFSSDGEMIGLGNLPLEEIIDISVSSFGELYILCKNYIHKYICKNGSVSLIKQLDISSYFSSSFIPSCFAIDFSTTNQYVYIFGGNKINIKTIILTKDLVFYSQKLNTGDFPFVVKIPQHINANSIYLLCDNNKYDSYGTSSSSSSSTFIISSSLSSSTSSSTWIRSSSSSSSTWIMSSSSSSISSSSTSSSSTSSSSTSSSSTSSSTWIKSSSSSSTSSSTWIRSSSSNSSSSSSVIYPEHGSLWVWSANPYGELGLSDTISRSSPTRISGYSNWLKSSTSSVNGDFSLRLKTDGSLWSCGFNQYGKLGLGNVINQSSPCQIGTSKNWIGISAGRYHSLCIKNDNTLYAFGFNGFGELGLGNLINKSSPTQVGTLNNWLIACAADQYSLAIKTNGTLWGWGRHIFGALGIPSALGAVSSPTQVGSMNDWAYVDSAFSSASAIKTDGTLWSWGLNNYGQLGLGNTITRSSPTQVGTSNLWSKIAVAGYHSLAIKPDGSLWSWGWNSIGELGIGTVLSKSSPTRIGTLNTWKAVAAAYQCSFALKTDGTIWAWGDNNVAQLGLGDIINRSSPTQIGNINTWKQIFRNHAIK